MEITVVTFYGSCKKTNQINICIRALLVDITGKVWNETKFLCSLSFAQSIVSNVLIIIVIFIFVKS